MYGWTGGVSVVYEAAANGTPIGVFTLVVLQVSQNGQNFRFWLNGAQPSFRLTLDFVVAMGATQGDYSGGSSGTNSLSISYVSPTTGVEYATPPITSATKLLGPFHTHSGHGIRSPRWYVQCHPRVLSAAS